MRKPIFILLLFISSIAFADDGSKLWLKYDLIKEAKQRESYAPFTKFIAVSSDNQTLKIASEELQMGLQVLLGKKIATVKTATSTGGILLNVNKNAPSNANLSNEGFEIYTEKGNIVISSKS
jgi:alpha-glucuronidase